MSYALLILLKLKVNRDSTSSNELSPVDKLLAKLSEQQAVISRQHEALKTSEDIAYSRTVDYVVATSSSIPITPATETFNNSTAPTTNTPSIVGEDKSAGKEDLERLRAELEAANSKIARMDQELAQSRITKHTLDQAIGNVSEAEFPLSSQSEERLSIPPLQSHNPMRPTFQRDGSWATQDDSRSDTSEALSAGGYNRSRAIWGNGTKPAFGSFPAPAYQQPSESLANSQWMNRGFGQPFVETPMPFAAPPPITAFRASVGPERMMQDSDLLVAQPLGRRGLGGRFGNKSQSSFPYASSNSSFDGYTPVSGYGSAGGNPGSVGGSMCMNMGMNGGLGGIYGSYQPQPIGTPLSPHAPEFTSVGPGWKNDVSNLDSMAFTLANDHRLLQLKVKPIFQPLSLSTIVVSLIVLSTATGSTLLTRLFAITTNKLLSFSNRSSRLAQPNKNTISLKQSLLKPIP